MVRPFSSKKISTHLETEEQVVSAREHQRGRNSVDERFTWDLDTIEKLGSVSERVRSIEWKQDAPMVPTSGVPIPKNACPTRSRGYPLLGFAVAATRSQQPSVPTRAPSQQQYLTPIRWMIHGTKNPGACNKSQHVVSSQGVTDRKGGPTDQR